MNKASWFKSSYSGGDGTNCVEIALFSSYVGIRDSKAPALRAVTVPEPAWKALVAELRSD
ncbi:DUF397 domain-containing protein [Streptomyces sp. AV19]|uniref:DUF397 domain-containing protein n=1 Tax=Streptomyces sp. AV19 TaxID=2793068 RepID=UPI0018FE3A6A|nr:DUF397 domain-containing protein [Streptomyces sp. AV19]MBH1938442.1 DUF397 domain-containing protein [Streptomyces sp. AV19]MDG4535090.1 DUF397 domain-containing protein [Streptomyces sp. AV19]